MTINVDTHCIIGAVHDNCEDYALAGVTESFAYAIVSDGCSSSKNTDIGARLIVHSASQIIENEIRFSLKFMKDYNDETTEDCLNSLYDYIGKEVIAKANSIRQSLNLEMQSLDASLLIALKLKENGRSIVFAYGDGNIIAKSKDELRLISIHYNHNAPNYLSYQLSPCRQEIYDRSVIAGNKKSFNVYNANGDMSVVDCENQTKIDRSIFVFDDPDYIALSSDGMESYNDKINQIKTFDIFKKFTDFKNYNGEFVKRRLKAFERECNKLSWKHDDDISLSVIYTKRETTI